MTHLEKLIADNRWRPIEEAPRDGTQILILSDWSGMDIDVATYDFNLKSWWSVKIEMPINPSIYIPFPDNRLADICQVLVDALEQYTSGDPDLGVKAVEALAKAEAIAKGDSDDK